MLQSLFKLDEAVFRFINSTVSNPVSDFIFPLFNSGSSFIPLIIAGIIYLTIRNSTRLWAIFFVVIAFVVVSDWSIFNPLKQLIARHRPAATLDHVRILASGAAGGWSFPSSHTANCFMAATMLGFLFPSLRILFYSLATIIGISRIYVGVHYPSDVVGSALLGSILGWGAYLVVDRREWLRKLEHVVTNKPHSGKEKRKIEILGSGILATLALGAVQVARFLWCIKTQLSPPALCIHLWSIANDYSSGSWILKIVANIWFNIFGSSAVSLWLIPWMFQTVFILLLGILIHRKLGQVGLWALVACDVGIPLISELNFLSSPNLAFNDSLHISSIHQLTVIFYLVTGFALLLSAALFVRQKPESSILTILGFIIAIAFPSIPWAIVILSTVGTLLNIGEYLTDPRNWLTKTFKIAFTLLLLVGTVLSIGVYNPRFLRKFDISILPRNSPLYPQFGWREWAQSIRPLVEKENHLPILTDSELSRERLQYHLGKQYHVISISEGKLPDLGAEGAFYVSEVYFNAINPEVIFVARTDRNLIKSKYHIEMLLLKDLFFKGDPIRQFNLFRVKMNVDVAGFNG